jgi:hypothetical protein
MPSPPPPQHDLDAVHEHLSAALDSLARALRTMSRDDLARAAALARRLTDAQVMLSALTRRDREAEAVPPPAHSRRKGAHERAPLTLKSITV